MNWFIIDVRLMMLTLFSPDFQVFSKQKKNKTGIQGKMPLFSTHFEVISQKKSSLFNELILSVYG